MPGGSVFRPLYVRRDLAKSGQSCYFLAMRSENATTGRKGSFIEEARRRQIIASAVEVIAEFGYGSASLARIARNAGISKGVISYHFDGKDELMSQVVVQLYVSGAEYMTAQIAEADGPHEQLMVYLQSNLDFIDDNRQFVAAAGEVVLNLRNAEGKLKFVDENDQDTVLGPLADLLEAGQKTGTFGDFDPRVMAMSIRDAIDGVATRVVHSANFDLPLFAQQMKRLFDVATRGGA